MSYELLQLTQASITNIRYSSPKHNPHQKFMYAEVYSKDGELLIAATLEHCIERITEAVKYFEEMHVS